MQQIRKNVQAIRPKKSSMFNEQQRQKKKRLKRQKFIGIAAIFQNLLSRNGRFSYEKLENIYSYHSYLF